MLRIFLEHALSIKPFVKKLLLSCLLACLPCWVYAGNHKLATRTTSSSVHSETTLLINPVATIEGIVEGLSNLPELPGLIFEYLETIEGDRSQRSRDSGVYPQPADYYTEP